MNKLQNQIQRKKDAIAIKKRILQKQMRHSKKHLSSTLIRDFSILGGLVLGYMILPKRLGRFLFKSMSLIGTINTVKDVVQNQLLESRPRKSAAPKAKASTKRRRQKKIKHEVA